MHGAAVSNTVFGGITLMFAFASPMLYADPALEAEALFTRMNQAGINVSYKGSFIYSRDGKMETMRIVHINDGDGVFEQLTLTTGKADGKEPRRVYRRDDQVFCPFPGGKGLRHNRLRFTSIDPQETIATLKAHYKFDLLNRERVTGRECQVIALVPQDSYRYGYRIWIDLETGLLMRTDVVDGDKVVENMMFAELTLLKDPPKVSKKKTEAALNGAAMKSKTETKQGPQIPQWRAELPPGFFLAEHKLDKQKDRFLEHMVYTDGIASISVFIENQPHYAAAALENAAPKTVSKGAIHALALQSDRLARHITVVGEVPALTVQRIAETLQSTGP